MTGEELWRHRRLARSCGFWVIARSLRKQGWSIWQTRWILFSREEWPVLRLSIYLSPRRLWRVEGEKEGATREPRPNV